MIKATDPEFKIQSDFIRYLQLAHPELLYTISPAGFIMSAGMAMKMIRMGYRKGTLDILFFEPRGPWHGFFLEIKAPGGSLGDSQKDFMYEALLRGYSCAVSFSDKEAIDVLEAYLSNPSVK